MPVPNITADKCVNCKALFVGSGGPLRTEWSKCQENQLKSPLPSVCMAAHCE